MKNAVFNFPLPANEPVKSYLKGSPERVALEAELKRQSSIELDIPLIIGGKEVRTGNTGKVVMPHDHAHVLATYHKAGPEEVRMAIKAALDAHEEWDGPRLHHAQDSRPARRQVPRRDQRSLHARTEQELLSGRD